MDDKVIIAKRVAQELRDGELVNLGIGLPTMVSQFLPPGVTVYLQTENGLVGMAQAPEPGLGSPMNVDAGGRFAGAIPGAASIDSCVSFGLIRGGHLDVSVLGGLEVDEEGHLANWMVPGKMVPGMGGAMDLVTGAKHVIVAMTHTAKGRPKIVKKCTLPLTSIRRVSLIVTEMAVIEPTEDGLVLLEIAPSATLEQVIAATGASLIVREEILEMPVRQDVEERGVGT
jgi:acetate CoA/acetoacetate CoA-transferase beta subunit